MSKKKNTLKDLDEFLKQQAATLAPPSKLSDQVKSSETTPEIERPTIEKALPSEPVELTDAIKQWATEKGEDFRPAFYKLIIDVLEVRGTNSSEDKMLINTALYLLHGENWKEAIRQYWRSR